MNFFEKISQLGVEGNLVLVVGMQPGVDMTVSVLLNNPVVSDTAQHALLPLLFSGPAAKIDEIFISEITKPMQVASQLLLNMEAHLKSQELVRQNSQLQREIDKAQKAEKDAKKKTFDALMVKVDELMADNKFEEALKQLPKIEEYPDQAALIDKKAKEIKPKLTVLTLNFT